MEKSDWVFLVETAPQKNLTGTMWRVVESQEEIATMALVDSLEEQELLEGMLELSKPPCPSDTDQFDYLLRTPFRYPPLVWGSRFGSRLEPSLYYGSLEIETALAECAFYRLVFWQGVDEPFPSGRLVTQHTIFSVSFLCKPGIALQSPPFDTHLQILSDKQSYASCQTLGSILREAGIHGFSFFSARCPKNGLNIALFTPKALASKKPEETQSWLCETNTSGVKFKSQNKTLSFGAKTFWVDGSIPSPA